MPQLPSSTSAPGYVGRFAPTPTGPLHFGSLIAAVASYCDARAAGGKWLLRMEDLDPPREMPGAARRIITQMKAYGFEWDGELVFQSNRLHAYHDAVSALQAAGHLFWCSCSRSDLARNGSLVYPGHCRAFTSPRRDAAVRVRIAEDMTFFTDRVFGAQQEEVAKSVGDFVILRRDGLFAYQLAVVVDDAFQGVTDVVRGADLLDNTARQIVLQKMLGHSTPRYLHLPLALHADGTKLSKQTLATEIPTPADGRLVWKALEFLGQQPSAGLMTRTPRELLVWGIKNWRPEKIPARQGFVLMPD
ncbi:MAG: tRNA glutamyl-Q(34) synthetase GluQRS [Moraxellaceae bacterium]